MNGGMSSHPTNPASMAKLRLENFKSSPQVFDKLIVHVSLPINIETKRRLLVEHKDVGGLHPDIYKKRTTIRSVAHPFTFLEYGSFIRCELNPNYYKSFQNVYLLLDSFFLNFSPEKAEVKGLHLNVDVPLYIPAVFESLSFKSRSKVDIYNSPVIREYKAGKNNSIYYGHYNNRLVVYDKARELKITGITLTRFERRLHGNHDCPIKTLSNVRHLLEIEPFEDIEFNELSAFDPSTPHEEMLWRGVRQLIQEDGMHNAIRKLSRTGHFKRDWKKYIEKKSSPDFQSPYLDNMRMFLVDR